MCGKAKKRLRELILSSSWPYNSILKVPDVTVGQDIELIITYIFTFRVPRVSIIGLQNK